MKPEYFMRGYCPLIEEFHIRNIVGCLERKQWVFGDIVTLSGKDYADLTLSSLSGGFITHVPINPRTGLPNYLVLAQVVEVTGVCSISNQTEEMFRLNGTAGNTYHVVVMTTEPSQPSRRVHSQRKWASDYCPYCKSQGFKGVVGSVLKDLACFSFKVFLRGGASMPVKFATVTDTTGKHVGVNAGLDFYYETGQELPNRVTMMADNQYQIIITKCDETGGAVINPPFPSSIAKDGFTLNGDVDEEYDVLILGQIQF